MLWLSMHFLAFRPTFRLQFSITWEKKKKNSKKNLKYVLSKVAPTAVATLTSHTNSSLLRYEELDWIQLPEDSTNECRRRCLWMLLENHTTSQWIEWCCVGRASTRLVSTEDSGVGTLVLKWKNGSKVFLLVLQPPCLFSTVDLGCLCIA